MMRFVLCIAVLLLSFSSAHAKSDETAKAEVQTIMQKAVDDLEASGIVDNSLAVGQKAPDFSLPNVQGREVSLYDLLKQGPVVLTFYRGVWCPYCNLQLNVLQQRLDQIKAHGGQLVAVSPQLPDSSLATVEKNSLTFEVLSDVGSDASRAFGIVFTLPEALRPIYEGYGIDVEKHNGSGNFELPVPATFVIGSDGVVVYAFKDVDYKKRAEPEDIIKALEGLK